MGNTRAKGQGESETRTQRASALSVVKSLLLIVLGFYLGNLHSSLYHHLDPNHPTHHLEGSSYSTPLRQEFQSRPDEAKRSLQGALQSTQNDLQQCQAEKRIIAEQQQAQKKQDQQDQQSQINIHPLCQRFPQLVHGSPLALWIAHLPDIHAASQLQRNDPRYFYHDYTAQLLQIITPRLPRSTLNLPHAWSTNVARLLDKVNARLRYLSATDDSVPHAPAIQIVLLGGSILIGRNCRKLNKDLNIQFPMPNRECTYANRLHMFLWAILERLVSGDSKDPDRVVFNVTKIAMGGTNTAVGAQIFKYDLVPDLPSPVDIVINGYATNDMHVLTVLEAQSGNQTLGQRVFEMIQDFVRTIIGKGVGMSCQSSLPPPLLMYFEDYLGNEQREIWATMALSQVVGSLADYYGFSRVSYANVVRDIVYGDTQEYWFSPEGWWPSGGQAASSKQHANATVTMLREIHPGMGMHIISAWIIAYNLLAMAATYCSMETILETKELLDYESTKFAQIVPFKDDNYKGRYSNIPGKPRNPPNGLPPILTPSLSLESISDLWRAQAKENPQCGNVNDDSLPGKRCIFAWISGLSQQQQDAKWIEALFGVHTVQKDGWKLVDENGKLGYMPQKLGDKMTLDFTNISQPIRTVTIFILKSYGTKWHDSRVRASVSEQSRLGNNDWNVVSSLDLQGVHAKNTSEMYPETMELARALPPGVDLQVSFELTGGTTFKIMGLAICS